jgi:hypothetical protein
LNKEDIKAAAKEAAALSLKEIPGVPMEVGAASKSVRHYQDINAAAKEGAALSLAEIRGVSMEVGAASKSVVQYFPSTLNSDDVLGKFCTADFDAAPTSIEKPRISASESAAPSLAAAFISWKCPTDFDADPTSIGTPGISANERVVASLAAAFISSLFNVRGRGYLSTRSGKFCGYYYYFADIKTITNLTLSFICSFNAKFQNHLKVP